MKHILGDMSGRQDDGAGACEDDEEQVPHGEFISSLHLRSIPRKRIIILYRRIRRLLICELTWTIWEELPAPLSVQEDFPRGVLGVRQRMWKKTRPTARHGVVRDGIQEGEQVPHPEESERQVQGGQPSEEEAPEMDIEPDEDQVFHGESRDAGPTQPFDGLHRRADGDVPRAGGCRGAFRGR